MAAADSDSDSSPCRRRTVTLSYAKAGTVPPVFVAGSFSSPPWQPLEMTPGKQLLADGSESGEYEFRRLVTVSGDASSWQYKFRLGHGDWWVLDERAETTTDDAGNMNNLLVLQVDEQHPPSPSPPTSSNGPADSNTSLSSDTAQLPSSQLDCSRTDTTSTLSSTASAQFEAEDAADAEEDYDWSNSAPMLPHELISDHASPSPSDHLPDLLEENEAELDDDHEHDAAQDPAGSLLDERILPHGQITFSLDPPTPTDVPMEMPSEDVSKLVLGAALDDPPLHTEGVEGDTGSPPLTPTGSDGLVTEFLDIILHADEDENARVEHAPLFAYECMGGGEEGVVRPATSSPRHDSLPAGTPERVDIDASTLEEFPTDAQRIFEFIEETKARLSEDITSDDDSRLSTPVHMPATPVDTYFSQQHPLRLSPKGEQAQHLAQIPECVLPDLAMDVPSPTRIAFNVQSSDGILLDQDGLFDVPRRISSCRRASNEWSDTRLSPSARGSDGSFSEGDGMQDRRADTHAKQATDGGGESSSSSGSSGDFTSQMSAPDKAVQHQKPSAPAPSQSEEPASPSLPSPPKAVVSFRQGDVTTPWKLAQYDGVYDLLRGLRGSVQRPGRMTSYAVVTSAIALCLYLYR